MYMCLWSLYFQKYGFNIDPNNITKPMHEKNRIPKKKWFCVKYYNYSLLLSLYV